MSNGKGILNRLADIPDKESGAIKPGEAVVLDLLIVLNEETSLENGVLVEFNITMKDISIFNIKSWFTRKYKVYKRLIFV